MDACMSLLGANDQHLAVLEQECGVTIALRGSELHISGDEASAVSYTHLTLPTKA